MSIPPSPPAISNIVVKDSLGNPIADYDFIASDAERTNSIPGSSTFETVSFGTNGGAWRQFAILGTPGTVAVSGVGTQTVTVTGTNLNNPVADYVFTSHSPTAVTLTESNAGGSVQGFAILTAYQTACKTGGLGHFANLKRV